MEQDAIAAIEIDHTGRLHVVPASRSCPYIYREAMDVHWDSQRRSFHSPELRSWPYSRWFQQILAAAREQGVNLKLSGDTRWLNVEPGIKDELIRAAE